MLVNKNFSENHADKTQRSLEYIECLEEERRKIQVFQRELPLCLDLVSQAIETCRKEISLPGKWGSFEHTSRGGPVLEEFIPMKNASSFSSEDEQRRNNQKGKNVVNCDDGSNAKSTKLDWLQLWKHTPDQSTDKDSVREVSISGVQKNGSGGAFQPFKKDTGVGSSARRQQVTAPNVKSIAENGGRGGASSKARRSWSPDLHRRFVAALEELGGAYVATPKQIREKMQVDGLTNDEIKSHLQKYRLHEKPSSSSSTQETQTQGNILPSRPPPQTAPQFVVLGGLWVPPAEYSCTVARTLQPGEGT
ncbi:transcription factor HHO2-like [Apium graveolens]|uniref:transcription factor HHO2-like n=1 Tax=Apium graveolens TaxID=4045 RepID=UPI003D7BF817